MGWLNFVRFQCSQLNKIPASLYGPMDIGETARSFTYTCLCYIPICPDLQDEIDVRVTSWHFCDWPYCDIVINKISGDTLRLTFSGSFVIISSLKVYSRQSFDNS